jgi:molybdate-binding protein
MLAVRSFACCSDSGSALATELPDRYSLNLKVSFMGSLHALKEFAEGRVDVAGFHVPIGGRPDWDHAPIMRDLRARRDRLIRFVDRDQGLILPHGNPLQVKNFRDIARQQLRFINRQPGSGTRLLIDQMIAYVPGRPLQDHRLAARRSSRTGLLRRRWSGGADAGFGPGRGCRASARVYPAAGENATFLAVRAKTIDSAAVVALQALRSQTFARIAREFAGYRWRSRLHRRRRCGRCHPRSLKSASYNIDEVSMKLSARNTFRQDHKTRSVPSVPR